MLNITILQLGILFLIVRVSSYSEGYNLWLKLTLKSPKCNSNNINDYVGYCYRIWPCINDYVNFYSKDC